MNDYAQFLESKAITAPPTGLDEVPELNSMLFPFQRDIVGWALRRGRAAIFADCGLGKTPMQLEWASHVPGDVLILAPLAVGQQTVREGRKFGIEVNYCRDQSDAKPGITITNYEMMDRFDPSRFDGVVLDESSILKAYDGKMRGKIIEAFRETPYRLACTATPAPNDYTELGQHSDFLGGMNPKEMLAMYFTHGHDTKDWRLKGHANQRFWEWVCSWAVMIRKPSDLGYEDGDFILPPMDMHTSVLKSDKPTDGFLFPMEARTLQERLAARRTTIQERADLCAEIVNASDEPWLLWCNLNAESEALAKAIPDAVEVRGAQSLDLKEQRLTEFSDGKIRVMITKPTIAGHGMNWQHCANVAFVGLSDSYEQYYQAVRRCWRFGQKSTVNVHVITSELEGAVVANIQRKERDAAEMARNMTERMADITKVELGSMGGKNMAYERDKATGKGWELHLADCVDLISETPDDSIHFTIFSPPFQSLYTFSDSARDMSNNETDDGFYEHYGYMARELLRIMMPGRLVAVHCMDIAATLTTHGYIGTVDFRSRVCRAMESAGWWFHGHTTIWKDPVTAAVRSKNISLLYKQLRKDSCISRMGYPDYLLFFRKPGDNPEPVAHTRESFPLDQWRKWAEPIWMDVKETDVLPAHRAKAEKDEKHIAPLQLPTIRRAIRLYTNEGDLVFSPFAGIGSEGYVALREGRRFLGSELKRSYWDQAVRNLTEARAMSLFEGIQ